MSNIWLIRVPERENRENKGEKIISWIIQEKFREVKVTSLQIGKIHLVPIKNK